MTKPSMKELRDSLMFWNVGMRFAAACAAFAVIGRSRTGTVAALALWAFSVVACYVIAGRIDYEEGGSKKSGNANEQ